MARRRLQQSLADYVAQAISPVLIMLLVGTLVFFLLEVSYAGQFEARFQWILFWFVFANVLIARIAIEQGSDYASFYGLGLAGATALVVMRYLDAVIPAWCLLGLIWWCANQLTWDCTLIDDDEDASGEGLLAASGFASNPDDSAQPASTATTSPDLSSAGSKAKGKKPRRWWKMRRQRSSQPHAPGMWVIYFSLAALPLFGLGQLMLPRDDVASRNYGFRLLWLYVAAALGLLLTTSFLGIRRYLRQRNLQMPGTMAASWLGLGAVLIAGVLFITLWIPRPDGVDGLASLADRVDVVVGNASPWAILGNEKTEGDGRRIGRTETDAGEGNAAATEDEQGQPGGEKPGKSTGGTEKNSTSDGRSGGESSERGSDEVRAGENKNRSGADSEGSKSQSSSDQPAGQEQAGDRNSDDEDLGNPANDARDRRASSDESAANPQGQSRTPPPSSWKMPEFSLSLGKLLVYGAAILIAIVLLYRNRLAILAVLRTWWNDWLAFWAKLFGGGHRDQPDAAKSTVPEASFADFANPFHNGSAQHMSTAELAQYTFNALQAWGKEQGCPRPDAQTPFEYAHELGQRIPAFSREIDGFSQLYARLAYSRLSPPANSYQQMEAFWRTMQTPVSL